MIPIKPQKKRSKLFKTKKTTQEINYFQMLYRKVR
jgi:hypothetical protein